MLARVQDLVPEVYINESRDFQLLSRLYDCIFQGVKFDIDSIRQLTNTDNCLNIVLSLLQTKLGFFSDIEINNDDLREILKVFPYLIREKGSSKAIADATLLFLKLNKIDSQAYIYESGTAGQLNREHYIRIGFNAEEVSLFKDIRILDEILKYLLPIGYYVNYFFFKKYGDIDPDNYQYQDLTLRYIISNNINSTIYSNEGIKFSKSVGTTNIFEHNTGGDYINDDGGTVI